MRTQCFLAAFAAVFTLVSLGCSEEPSRPPPMAVDMGPEPDFGPGGDMGEVDMGEPTAMCEDDPEDLAALIATAPVERAFFRGSEADVVSCAEALPEAKATGQYLFEFVPSASLELTWTVDPLPHTVGGEFVIPPQPLVELRRGGTCEAPERIVICSQERSNTFALQKDVPYVLVINGELSSPGFKIKAEERRPPCAANEETCVGEALQVCRIGQPVVTHQCADGCFDDAACAGDTCATAIAVDPGAGRALLSGDRAAHTNGWSAAGLDNCSINEPGRPGVDTPNGDFFVKLENLEEGQEVVINATDSMGNYAFFVLESCDATACLHAASFDSSNANRTVWRVPAGTSEALLVVEALGGGDRSFVVQISAQ